jgi:cytochrome c
MTGTSTNIKPHRFISLITAFILPPLSVRLTGWRTVAQLVCLVLFLTGLSIFWFVYAGPGLLLWMSSILMALAFWVTAKVNGIRPSTKSLTQRLLHAIFTFATVFFMAVALTKPQTSSIDPNVIAQGRNAFKTCAACHNTGVAPNLRSIVGRPAGQVEGYDYSYAMRSSGIIWETETLAEFMRDPEGYIPGTKMAVSNLDEETINNVIAYLNYLAR